MRLFVSIDFPESILKEIHSWIPDLKGWKKASIHQMHLTLVFLGNCSEMEKDQIDSILSKIEFTPFELIIEGLGAFPNEISPQILWTGVRQNVHLLDLQHRISDSVEDHIQSKDSKSYIPHITLARKKGRKRVNHTVKESLQRETEKLVVKVESFQLKQSILKTTGSVHEILNSYS